MYEKIFNNFIYPAYESGFKRRHTLKYRKQMLNNQWLRKDELEALQWQALTRLLSHAFQQSPYFNKVLNAAGIRPGEINSLDDFVKIPICSKEDVSTNLSEMIAVNSRESVRFKSTGGSTGTPLHFALNDDSNQWRMAAAQRGYGWANCAPGQPTVYIWGVDIGDPTPWKKFKLAMYHRAFNRKMFNCFDFGEREMDYCLEYIHSRHPNGIVGFTSAVYNLARYAEEIGVNDCHVDAVITGAEKLYPHQREIIERVFSTRVFNTYGCREFMLIAAECEKHEGLHATIDNLYIELVDADGKPVGAGETGEVVITDLHNYGMPFIRYKNGDVATWAHEPCSCGRGLPLIKEIDGRKLDVMRATSGKSVSGGFFPHLMKEFKEIRKFQVVQKSLRSIEIKLVLNKDFPESSLAFCSKEIRRVLGDSMAIDYQFVDDIPLTSSGKHRVTISELPAER